MNANALVLRSSRSAIALAALIGAGCSAVLGLDAPTLDPCAAGGCADGASPAPTRDASSPGNGGGDAAAPEDAALAFDVVVTSDGNGVRCGEVANATYCATGICCLANPGSTPTYVCVPTADDCPGYPIECASYNDCPGNDVCCAYESAMKCEPENTASCQSVFVCPPGSGTAQCSAGQTCDVALWRSDAGIQIPYDICGDGG